MIKQLLALVTAILLLGCIQPPATAPTVTPPPVISAATATPIATALTSNFSNEIEAFGDAIKEIKLLNGEFLKTFDEVKKVREKVNAYAGHLQSLDPEENETVFLQKNVEVAYHFLDSNNYYLGAFNTGNTKTTTENFTCKDAKAYRLTLNLTGSAVSEGKKGIEILYSLVKQYPALAAKAGTKFAADLINSFYAGMDQYALESNLAVESKCG